MNCERPVDPVDRERREQIDEQGRSALEIKTTGKAGGMSAILFRVVYVKRRASFM